MKSTQRHAAAAVGFLALSLIGAPRRRSARRQVRPAAARRRAEAGHAVHPHRDVPERRSRSSASTTADEIRKRIRERAFGARSSTSSPKNNINNTLEASGYKRRLGAERVGPHGARQAAPRRVRARRQGQRRRGTRRARSSRGCSCATGQHTLAQPLPAIDGKDAGDAAKQVEKALTDALKGMPAYKTVHERSARAEVRRGGQGRAGRHRGVSELDARASVPAAGATVDSKASPDSIIAVAERDSGDRSDAASSRCANLGRRVHGEGRHGQGDRVQPAHLSRGSDEHVASRRSSSTSSRSPARPTRRCRSSTRCSCRIRAIRRCCSTKWLLQLRAKQYKQALATGDESSRLDTARGDARLLQPQIGAAQSDSNAAAVQQLAAQAGQKFPKETSFRCCSRRAPARRASCSRRSRRRSARAEIDPKNPSPWLFVLATQNQMNQPDSVLATRAEGDRRRRSEGFARRLAARRRRPGAQEGAGVEGSR